MNRSRFAIGATLVLIATISWGAMFPVAKAAMIALDAFYLTAIRYGIAALLFAAILWKVEGARGFRLERRGIQLAVFGAFGFAGFSLFAFVGLSLSRAESAAIVMASMPLLTALVKWIYYRERPNAVTGLCIVAALIGVLLVIAKGNIGEVLTSGAGLGDLLVFIGAFCWVIYTLGAGVFNGWSPLRYTTLSCLFGTGAIFIATAVATRVGYAHAPSLDAVYSVRYELAYTVVIAAVVAVLSWNAGVKLLGALDGVLFFNLVPITAFAIGMAQGHRFAPIELFGAALTIAALVANNFNLRYRQRALAASNAAV